MPTPTVVLCGLHNPATENRPDFTTRSSSDAEVLSFQQPKSAIATHTPKGIASFLPPTRRGSLTHFHELAQTRRTAIKAATALGDSKRSELA